MKILIVANYNPCHFSPFVIEQTNALRQHGCEIDFFGIVGKGLMGYLKNRSALIRKIKESKPDIVHAHYGLSGLLANLQRRVPVITTFHGSDIHSGGINLKLSKLAMRLSAYNIFVNPKLKDMAGYARDNASVLPCGLDLDTIVSIRREDARRAMGLDPDKKMALFASSFSNPVKNSELAKSAAALIPELELKELKGFSREQVNLMMNAADVLLMTSHREGSPMVIKEAMACGTPVVSVDVGDVRDVMGDTPGCYIAERTPEAVAAKLHEALAYQGKTPGRERIVNLGLDNNLVAKNIIDIYKETLTKR